MQFAKQNARPLSRPTSRNHASVRNVAAMATPKLKLIYFDLPGRAEATRLMLSITKTPFEDFKLPKEQWPELKPKTPFGQLPVLEVDGQQLAQSSAIEHYVAKITGLYPADPWEAAQVDQIVAFMTEFLEALIHTFYIKDSQEKLAARKAAVEGPLKAKLTKLNEILEGTKPDAFIAGPKITYADVHAFVILSNLISGFFDGVPADLYAPFPAVTAYHERIARLPEVMEHYAGAKGEGLRAAYLPGAASKKAA